MNLNIEKLVNRAIRFQMETNFKRIKDGKQLDLNKKPYTVELMNKMISFFEEEEEYEKCDIILNFKIKLFDHESNYFK